MRIQDAVAEFIDATKVGTARYFAGFDDTNHTRQAPHLPNHLAWCLGHCALTMHRTIEKFGAGAVPETDFIAGATRGDRARFGIESVAFGSTPTSDAAAYPSFARCIEVFNAASDRLARTVRDASDGKLRETTAWGPSQIPLYLLAMRMCAHNGTHTGQIADLRRALGFESIFA